MEKVVTYRDKDANQEGINNVMNLRKNNTKQEGYRIIVEEREAYIKTQDRSFGEIKIN